ncbi:MAG: rieske 2Fe-2S iron-sulfur domain protein [Chloroflexi bacterium]|nr:rieske 2Fe-2S iron-sulfur domain protein [Chloroflexota bacterium]
MLTKEENERLTQVGAGTPTGEMMRRYWHPIAASSQLTERGTRPVRLLGEDLVLYRDRSGGLGLVAQRCPHRRAGMIFGIPEQEGLRCAYHGWLFNAEGRCLEQPFEQTEDPNSTFKDRVAIKAYPVEEYAGLIWAYLGPQPAPLIPHWDLFAWEHVPKDIGMAIIPCNWLQVMENSMDPVHAEWLHGAFHRYALERLGRGEGFRMPLAHQKIGFTPFEYGVIKRRLRVGVSEDHDMWAVGHPVVFPNILKGGSTSKPDFQIRVPIDDTHTLHFWYQCYRPQEGVELPTSDRIPCYEVPVPTVQPDGDLPWEQMDNNSGQDVAMWYTQGPTSDRWNEHLGASDRGVILFRKMLEDSVRTVERGDDPLNVFRDAASNVCIDLPVEGDKSGRAQVNTAEAMLRGNASKYSSVLRQAVTKALAAEPAGPSTDRR